ncbi:MAG: hypothetical protein ASARMPRED_004714 [Alectoria sarmentosa]|nr:MAG: hypothetical protein ASARMPRED_004714 [Alectoria sarmentosa]
MELPVSELGPYRWNMYRAQLTANTRSYTLNGQSFNKCIVVYIDGDSLEVKDEVMKRGFPGGIDAAQSLRSHIVEHFGQKSIKITRDLGVVIYVYANLKELDARYLQAKPLREFCEGFNSAHPWSCYDDMSVSPRRKYQLREVFLKQFSSGDCVRVAFIRPTSAGFQALMDAQPNKNDLAKKLMSISLPSDLLRPVAKPMSVEAMRIPVPPPPPELFQAPQNFTMVDVFRKVSSPTMRYPGKIDLFGTQGAASQSSAAATYSPFTIPRNRADQRIDPPTQAPQELVDRFLVGFQGDLEKDGTYVEKEEIDLKGWVNVGVE